MLQGCCHGISFYTILHKLVGLNKCSLPIIYEWGLRSSATQQVSVSMFLIGNGKALFCRQPFKVPEPFVHKLLNCTFMLTKFVLEVTTLCMPT